MTRALLALLGRRFEREPSDPRLQAFARGAAAGLLIGAAIAGSTLWRRRGRDAS